MIVTLLGWCNYNLPFVIYFVFQSLVSYEYIETFTRYILSMTFTNGLDCIFELHKRTNKSVHNDKDGPKDAYVSFYLLFLNCN